MVIVPISPERAVVLPVTPQRDAKGRVWVEHNIPDPYLKALVAGVTETGRFFEQTQADSNMGGPSEELRRQHEQISQDKIRWAESGQVRSFLPDVVIEGYFNLGRRIFRENARRTQNQATR